jgi:hypothetical protein
VANQSMSSSCHVSLIGTAAISRRPCAHDLERRGLGGCVVGVGYAR